MGNSPSSSPMSGYSQNSGQARLIEMPFRLPLPDRRRFQQYRSGLLSGGEYEKGACPEDAEGRSEPLAFACGRHLSQRPRQPIHSRRGNGAGSRLRLETEFFRCRETGRRAMRHDKPYLNILRDFTTDKGFRSVWAILAQFSS